MEKKEDTYRYMHTLMPYIPTYIPLHTRMMRTKEDRMRQPKYSSDM
jgi:hypothetical protein